jgi:hypothetical protein
MSGAQGGIAAFDLGTHTGHAYGHKGGLPITGTWTLPTHASNPGEMIAAAENGFHDFLVLHRPSVVWVEAHLEPQHSRGADAAIVAIKLFGALQGECYRTDTAPPIPIHNKTIRAKVLGHGNLDSDTAKREAQDLLRRLGVSFPDHNAADAGIVWLYAAGYAAPKRSKAR